jgi:hypothetical protein
VNIHYDSSKNFYVIRKQNQNSISGIVSAGDYIMKINKGKTLLFESHISEKVDFNGCDQIKTEKVIGIKNIKKTLDFNNSKLTGSNKMYSDNQFILFPMYKYISKDQSPEHIKIISHFTQDGISEHITTYLSSLFQKNLEKINNEMTIKQTMEGIQANLDNWLNELRKFCKKNNLNEGKFTFYFD